MAIISFSLPEFDFSMLDRRIFNFSVKGYTTKTPILRHPQKDNQLRLSTMSFYSCDIISLLMDISTGISRSLTHFHKISDIKEDVKRL